MRPDDLAHRAASVGLDIDALRREGYSESAIVAYLRSPAVQHWLASSPEDKSAYWQQLDQADGGAK